MKRSCGGARRRGFLISSLLVLAGLGLGCGTTTNAQFCDEATPCPTGLECVDSACAEIDGPDASPSCPTATHQCVPNVPADWSGPMLSAELGNGEAFAACAAEEGAFVGGGSFEAAGECECSCTTAETVSCTEATMEAVGGSSIGCSFALCKGGCLTQSLQPGLCSPATVGILGENNVRMTPGALTGGSCVEGSGSATPAAEFQELLAMCPGEITDGDCGETAACAALAPEGFAQSSCIYQVGNHECPAESGYTERTVSFASLADERSCDSCECELPSAGTSCGGVVNSCSAPSVSQDNGCVASSVWNNQPFEYAPDPNDVECAPIEASLAVKGEVTGVDPTTICCTPTE